MSVSTVKNEVDPIKSDVEWHAVFGPAIPSHKWVPAPRYLLRRDRLKHHLAKLKPKNILDIGCGPAALLAELSAQGTTCFGVDHSDDALGLAKILQSREANMVVSKTLEEGWKGKFDLVMSCEVLEHIQEDAAALREWRDYVKPDGHIIVSVPAHPSRWNAADEWAGHVRRYTKKGLVRSLEKAGFVVEHIECYGFPLANIIELCHPRSYGKVPKKKGKSEDERTKESGVDRDVESRFWRVFSSFLGIMLMRVAWLTQRAFLRTQFGNGFIIIARKG